jgi:hypothetical protein
MIVLDLFYGAQGVLKPWGLFSPIATGQSRPRESPRNPRKIALNFLHPK